MFMSVILSEGEPKVCANDGRGWAAIAAGAGGRGGEDHDDGMTASRWWWGRRNPRRRADTIIQGWDVPRQVVFPRVSGRVAFVRCTRGYLKRTAAIIRTLPTAILQHVPHHLNHLVNANSTPNKTPTQAVCVCLAACDRPRRPRPCKTPSTLQNPALHVQCPRFQDSRHRVQPSSRRPRHPFNAPPPALVAAKIRAASPRPPL